MNKNSNLPKIVSIITICKNSAKTITKTIESVLSQRCEGLEYIIVDGNSNDGTQAIIKSFGKDIDIFISEPDEGIADAFNKGIALSSGEIIGIINSDDVLLQGVINRILTYFTTHPDTEVIHGDVLLYNDANFIKRIKPPKFWWLPWRLILFNHPATFVRKHVYQQHGVFSKDYKLGMDYDLFLRWQRAGVRISYLSEPLAKMQTGGVGAQYPLLSLAENRRALLKNGYPRLLVEPLVELQCLLRFAVQRIVTIQNFCRYITKK
ncbi:MAG: glycosyltransferase family 2 protein [Thermodesulfovibrionales bacterium]